MSYCRNTCSVAYFASTLRRYFIALPNERPQNNNNNADDDNERTQNHFVIQIHYCHLSVPSVHDAPNERESQSLVHIQTDSNTHTMHMVFGIFNEAQCESVSSILSSFPLLFFIRLQFFLLSSHIKKKTTPNNICVSIHNESTFF